MIPTIISERQKVIAEFYWNKSWTFLSREQVDEALDWWNMLSELERILCGPAF